VGVGGGDEHPLGRDRRPGGDRAPQEGHLLRGEDAQVQGHQEQLRPVRALDHHRLGHQGQMHAPGGVIDADVAQDGQTQRRGEIGLAKADAKTSHDSLLRG